MKTALNIKQQVDVRLGKAGTFIGQLTYVKQGHREHTAFAYTPAWLANPDFFSVSPDLVLTAGHQVRKAPSTLDSCFHFAIADTAPDAWGRRVTLRAHAKRRQANPALRELSELDFLLAVDDFSRIGALRLQSASGIQHETSAAGQHSTPAMLDLQHLLDASRAVELGRDSAADLAYLMGKATSLGGMRPKCTVIDHQGLLAIGKFPSVNDTRSVTRGEVLALKLARLAGIDAAAASVVEINGVAVAIIGRFDRLPDGARIPYLSAASLLQASRQDDHAYTEIADAIRAISPQPVADAQQLWRRMVFNHLITNVDDHLQNHGFLHVSHGHWRLAPAFDINPFPDKDRESKTWLSPAAGPVTDVAALLALCGYFALTQTQALVVLREVVNAIANWRQLALSASVGLKNHELDDFAPAFEHEQILVAQKHLT